MYGYTPKFGLLNSLYGDQNETSGTFAGDKLAKDLSSVNPSGEDLATTSSDSGSTSGHPWLEATTSSNSGSTSGHPWLDKLLAEQKSQSQAMGVRQIGSDVSTLGSNLTSQKMLNDQLDKQSAQQGVQNAGTTLDSIMKMYKNRSANLASNRGLNAVAGL